MGVPPGEGQHGWSMGEIGRRDGAGWIEAKSRMGGSAESGFCSECKEVSVKAPTEKSSYR